MAEKNCTPWDLSDTAFYVENRWEEPFAELRRTMPVSYRPDSLYGAYWSVVSHELIQEVENKPDIYSSSYTRGGITIGDALGEREFPNFIAMDRPRHTEQRKVVQPAFNPSEMLRRTVEIKRRTKELFDALPRDEVFNWVDHVSVPLTIGMLCILFDFPWEERHDLKRWSDWASEVTPDTSEERRARYLEQMFQMLARFDGILADKKAKPAADDLLSRMIHSDAMGNMDDMERLANIALLIVGGNDTTRNSMSGFIEACQLFPNALAQLKADPSLIPNASQEIIRWQSPVTHMRRTVTEDTVLDGQRLAAGDKVVLWYISGNRDEATFEDAARFDVTRSNARRHIGFGHGVHRCVGARLAELQLDALIGEIVSRNINIRVEGKIERLPSCFLHGFVTLPVHIVSN